MKTQGAGNSCPKHPSSLLGTRYARVTGRVIPTQLTLAEPKMEAVCSSFSSSSLRGWMTSVMWQLLSVANLRKAPTM